MTLRRVRPESWPARRSGAASGGYATVEVGFINLMSDSSLIAAERQFLRLVAAAARDIHCRMSFFRMGDYAYQSGAAAHLHWHYQPAPEEARQLDALIVTGAVPSRARLQEEPFWDDLRRLVDWAGKNVRSTLFSCLSSHVALAYLYGVERRPLARKLWGVYPHRKAEPDNPLVADCAETISLPHSRHYGVDAEALRRAGLRVVVDGAVGPHLAVSADGLRFVFQQGHPEYGARTLLRELLRDAGPSGKGVPPGQLPENYFPSPIEARLREDRQFQETGRLSDGSRLILSEIGSTLQAPWHESAVTVTHGWLRALNQPETVSFASVRTS